ncbi:CRISPR-associated ring nuclease Crn1 [Sulfurisphaera javensis]|uniref:CRISPR-associated ring nuclease Crn1 n=1 Tax=Sulfurisphaera javensis TaxID=2049879 RepID=A0AAT9GTL1_9CREN
MVKLIATLGTSPGGVFETYTNLINGNYESDNPSKVEIDTIYLIRTLDKDVEFAFKLVKALFICQKIPSEVVEIKINISDITNKQEYEQFKSQIFQKIGKGDFVDFTGGRKAMSVAAAIQALKRDAYLVTTIIPQSEYNRIQNKLKELKNKENEINDILANKNLSLCPELNELIVHGARTILLS